MAGGTKEYLFTSESVTEGHPDKVSTWESTGRAAALRDAAGLPAREIEIASA